MSIRLAVDIDNVTLDWQGTWLDNYVLWFDQEVPTEFHGTWDGCTEGTHFQSMTEFWNWWQQAKLWDRMEPVPGALGALWDFEQAGISFIFCTARPDHGRDSALRLARSWETHVDFLNNKSKHLAKADVWVDDSPEVLENLAWHGKRAICLDRPWNQGAPCTHRASDWPEIVNLVKEMHT